MGVLEAFEHRKHHHSPGEHNAGEQAHEVAPRASLGGSVDEEDQYAEGNELEYTDPYCKLTYAQHVDPIGREVVDVKGEWRWRW